jgi:hypothetical protein
MDPKGIRGNTEKAEATFEISMYHEVQSPEHTFCVLSLDLWPSIVEGSMVSAMHLVLGSYAEDRGSGRCQRSPGRNHDRPKIDIGFRSGEAVAVFFHIQSTIVHS